MLENLRKDCVRKKIYLLCVEDRPVGFTEDADWAIRWENQLQGRSIKVITEIVPDKENEAREDVVKEEKPANPCVECGKGTEPYLGYVPFYSGAELKFIHQTCADERLKRGEKIYQ